MKCKNCSTDVHLKRWELGYRTCTSCSSETKWSSVPVINHKTGNEIQIIKDPEVAAEFLAKSARTGFGTLKGLSSGYRKRTTTEAKIEALPEKPIVDRELSRRLAPNDFDAVGSEVMTLLECGKVDEAYTLIDEALQSKRIYKVHSTQLLQIIDELTKHC